MPAAVAARSRTGAHLRGAPHGARGRGHDGVESGDGLIGALDKFGQGGSRMATSTTAGLLRARRGVTTREAMAVFFLRLPFDITHIMRSPARPATPACAAWRKPPSQPATSTKFLRLDPTLDGWPSQFCTLLEPRNFETASNDLTAPTTSLSHASKKVSGSASGSLDRTLRTIQAAQVDIPRVRQ